jgi:membrane protein implicated in regulation of membrane protease activity
LRRVLEFSPGSEAVDMIVIVGLIVLLVAVIVGFTGVLANTGAENFAVFGYDVTGSTGTLFLFGIVVGAVAMLGLSVLLAGARRTAARGRDTRRELARSQRETAFLNRNLDERLEHEQIGADTGATVNSEEATRRNRVPLLGRWSRSRQRTGTAHVDGPR